VGRQSVNKLFGFGQGELLDLTFAAIEFWSVVLTEIFWSSGYKSYDKECRVYLRSAILSVSMLQ